MVAGQIVTGALLLAVAATGQEGRLVNSRPVRDVASRTGQPSGFFNRIKNMRFLRARNSPESYAQPPGNRAPRRTALLSRGLSMPGGSRWLRRHNRASQTGRGILVREPEQSRLTPTPEAASGSLWQRIKSVWEQRVGGAKEPRLEAIPWERQPISGPTSERTGAAQSAGGTSPPPSDPLQTAANSTVDPDLEVLVDHSVIPTGPGSAAGPGGNAKDRHPPEDDSTEWVEISHATAVGARRNTFPHPSWSRRRVPTGNQMTQASYQPSLILRKTASRPSGRSARLEQLNAVPVASGRLVTRTVATSQMAQTSGDQAEPATVQRTNSNGTRKRPVDLMKARLAAMPLGFYPFGIILLGTAAYLVLGLGRGTTGKVDTLVAIQDRTASQPQQMWPPTNFGGPQSQRRSILGPLATTLGVGVTCIGALGVISASLGHDGPPLRWALLVAAAGQLLLLIGFTTLALGAARRQKQDKQWRQMSTIAGGTAFPLGLVSPGTWPWANSTMHWNTGFAAQSMMVHVAQLHAQVAQLSRQLDSFQAQGYNHVSAGHRGAGEAGSPE